VTQTTRQLALDYLAISEAVAPVLEGIKDELLTKLPTPGTYILNDITITLTGTGSLLISRSSESSQVGGDSPLDSTFGQLSKLSGELSATSHIKALQLAV
jgi:hypothetical protein